MAYNPRRSFERECGTIDELHDKGVITDESSDALREYSAVLDRTDSRYRILDEEGNAKSYSFGTAFRYLKCIRLYEEAGIDLTNTTAEEVNELAHTWNDDDLSASTLNGRQGAVTLFFKYHDYGVDPDDLVTFKRSGKPGHDETDLFTDEEIAAIRRACGTTNNVVRNRALVEMLIFTGQRLTALLSLRIKDIDLEEGYLYLNDDYAAEYDGLKGALKRGRKRPLFGAKKYIRDWIDYHPFSDDEENYLFISNPGQRTDDPPEQHLGHGGARQMLHRLGDEAEVDKPMNPHNFRHYFSTIMYRDYDLHPDTIRMLLGHVEGSSTFKRIYSHVIEADHIDNAEEALGYKDPDDTESSNPFTPETCTVCGEILQDNWQACPSCGQQFAPIAEDEIDAAADEIQDDATDRALDPESELSEEGATVMKAVLNAVEDPDALAKELASELGD